MAKILVVDDDPWIRQSLKLELEANDYAVDFAETGNAGLGMLQLHPYDLIILDNLLPDITGVDVCREFRSKGGSTPILMLTAVTLDRQVENALNSGADDYVTKPFNTRVLHARIRALLRRPQAMKTAALSYGDLILDTQSCTVTVGGAPVKLLPREFALLEFLMRNPNVVFSPEALLARVWQTSEAAIGADTVRSHIKTLRKKVDKADGPSYITTVHGRGYKFEPQTPN